VRRKILAVRSWRWSDIRTGSLSNQVIQAAIRAVNPLVQGPHPRFTKRKVYHWFEMCDAVQDERYSIDGIAVSNFVLPLYFTSSTEHGRVPQHWWRSS
jgi:hypothetical protein